MKLPEIQRSRAQQAQSMSPAQAAAPHLAKAKMLTSVVDAALDINEMIDMNQVNKEMAVVKDGINKFENWMATQREFDPEALEAMGIAGQIDMGAGGMVPKHKVYSAALKKFTEDLKGASGDRIGSARHREVWSEEVNNMVAPMITDSIVKQEEMAIDEMKLEAADSYQLNFEARNYEGARAAIDRYPTFTPVQRQAKKDAISALADASYEWDLQDEITIAISMNDADALDALALKHRDNNTVKGSPLTDDEHNVWASKIESRASAIRTGEKVAKTEVKAIQKQQYDNTLNEYWQANFTNPAALLANMPANLEDQDIRSIVSFAKKTAGGNTIKTDVPIWSMLSSMSTLEPEKFMEVQLLEYVSNLSTGDYQKLSARKDELILSAAGGNDIPVYQTNNQIYDAAFGVLSIASNTTTDKESRYQMTSVFASALDEQERYRAENNKQPMTLDEKKKIVNDIVVFEIEKKGDNFDRVEPFKNMRSGEVLDVLSELGRAGVPVTARSADAVEQLDDANIEVTGDTIRAAQALRQLGKMVNDKSINIALSQQ